jgi:hypothetical protein
MPALVAGIHVLFVFRKKDVWPGLRFAEAASAAQGGTSPTMTKSVQKDVYAKKPT